MKAPAVFILATLLLTSCFSPDPKNINSESATSAVPAIKDAGSTGDRKSIPALIRQLEANDPAIRFAAITALQQITGQTLDYRYYDTAEERRPAVDRWKNWLKQNPVP